MLHISNLRGLSVEEGYPYGHCLLHSFSQPGQGKGLLQSIPSDSLISTASQVPGGKLSVPVCSPLHSDGAHRLCSSFRLLCHSWNPNSSNCGMVRLPKLSASKTGSILCTYPVVLLKMLLGGWNPDTIDVEREGFFSLLSGFWEACSTIYYLFQ